MPHTAGFARLSLVLRHCLRELDASTAPVTDDTPLLWSRREWLTGLAASTTVAAMACGDDESETFDTEVAVIGGGLAGTHCAMRLAQAGIDVSLYEASSRLGGRTYTSREGHPDGQACELGGELIDSNHATMWALASELGITLDDRQQPGIGGETWWVGGQAVPEATITTQFVAVAPVFAAAMNAADTDDAAYDQLDRTTLADWLTTNCPPATYPELHAVLTSAYRGEFGRETHEQSALNLLYLIGSDDPDPFRIFGESDERWHSHEGSDAFVTRLAAKIDPARIQLGHRLQRLVADGSGYRLELATSAGSTTIRAQRVVLALPWTILRELDIDDAGLSAEKLALIRSLGYGNNVKVMGWFTTPIWSFHYKVSGSLTSDGALQQGWDSAIGQPGVHGIYTAFLGGDAAVALTTDAVAPWFASVVVPTIESVWHGAEAAFVPRTATTLLWPTHAFTKASYTCYLPGQWATWATEGVPEGGLHFCGEHCSADFQGWMEGAAETGALVAAALIDELGAEASRELTTILEAKLVVEQPAFGPVSRESRRRRVRQRRLAVAATRLRARVSEQRSAAV